MAGTESVAVRMLDVAAHDLRNQIATLHMAAMTVDDSEVAAAMRDAVARLRVDLERMVVAARIELDKRPDTVEIAGAELLRLGTARAGREGAQVTDGAVSVVPVAVAGPGTWLERLVADVIHGDDPAWNDHLARACTAELHEQDGHVEIRVH
ncbi:MAG: hypothetical protein KDC46_14635 [Thermoleophilia bacterium]|nr:hypothetical protein [Thermoleophilia bacterium]